MKKRKEPHEMPEIIRTYAKGFFVMGLIVAVLSLVAVCMYVRETAAARAMGVLPV